MTSGQWHQAKEILGDALELAPAAREAFVRNATRGDPALAAEVLRLLEEAERESGLLSRPMLADAKAVTREAAPRFAPSDFLASRFRIVRFIASGGMGEVYEAEDLELGERVALKAIRQQVASDPDLRALFKREVQLARRVTHPNVCRIFDLAQHEDPEHGEPTLLLSMELMEGQSLAEYLSLNGPLTFRSALPLIAEVAAGLQAIHDAGIVHGDLKPGNVMLAVRPGETAPRARVMDFGMAFAVGHQAAGIPTGEGLRGGTPDYLAPEQIAGGDATMATDVYAFALAIGEMLGVARADRLRPNSQHMPARWARILRRCLSNDAARRYQRPEAVAEALRAALVNRRNTQRVAAAVVCLAIAVGIGFQRLDLIRGGTANRLVLTESSSLEVWRASPDGKLLAATSWDTGNLAVADAGSGKVRLLTHRGANAQNEYGGAFGAVFSPDGRRIAYEWMSSRTDAEVRVIGSDGKGDHALFHDPRLYASLLDWSPDGARLLVSVQDAAGGSRLGTLSTKEGTLQFLQTQPAVGRGGRILFGNDGNSIVFDTRNRSKEGYEIHRLSLTNEESVLVEHTGASSIMGWSPDRRRLIFSSDLRGEPGIWAISVSARGAEGEARELVPNVANWEPLGLSRTGLLYYLHDASSMDVYTAVLDVPAGRTVSPPRRVSERFVGSYAFPSWSEDGARLSFLSTRERLSPAIGIYDTSSGRVRELQPGVQSFQRPQWVEHGSALMVNGRSANGQSGLFRVDPQSGESKLFRSFEDLEIFQQTEGTWSRDGRFHFNRYSDQRRGIFRLDLQTGERRVLYVPPPNVLIGMENLALSPDGRYLAFHARSEALGTSTLMLMPADGGGEARPLMVLKQPEAFPFGAFTWTPDSRAILAVKARSLNRSAADQRVSEIWLVPVDADPPRKIDFPAISISCLRLSADGRTIAFQVHHDRREIWVLQNFL